MKKLLKLLKKIKVILASRSLDYAGRDTWRCPMCLESTKGHAESYNLFCRECFRDEMNAASSEGRPPKPYGSTRPRSLTNPVCRLHAEHAVADVLDAPLLSHRGCKCRNPLWQGQTIAPLLMGDSLEFLDSSTGQTVSVSHWSLPRIVEAAKEVGAGLDAQGMWFPAAMVAAMQPSYRRSTRVMLWGPKSVGKTVLSSNAIAEPTFARDGSVVGVVNYVYASPALGSDKGRSGFPWQVYAEALQSVVKLGEFVSPLILQTLPGEVVRADRRTIYAAFFKGLTDDAEGHTLLMYDIAGEDLQRVPADEVRRLDATTDVTYLMIDAGDLAAIGSEIQQSDAKGEHSVMTALRALRNNSRKPMILVITKLDKIPDCDSATASTEPLRVLQQLKKELRAAGPPDFKSVDENLGKRSLEALKGILAGSQDRRESELLRHLSDGRAEAAFFIWTEGLRSATIEGQQSVSKLEPISFGVAQLIHYTVTRSERNVGSLQRANSA